RIIGRLPHPRMQITVFANDGRFPVQFELDGRTQVYRFRQQDTLQGLADVRRIVDEDFQQAVLDQFATMRKTQEGVMARHFTRPATDVFDLPEII
ncbi:MAG: hypothetical protein AAFZ52_04995, partial [Bacteroidota bacterium]